MRRSIWDTVALFEKRIRMIRKPAYSNTFFAVRRHFSYCPVIG